MIKQLILATALSSVIEGGVTHWEGFGVIGIKFCSLTGQIIRVVPNSPAEKAGIKKGDILCNPIGAEKRIIGKPGTYVKVDIFRDEKVIHYVMVRKDINKLNFEVKDIEIKKTEKLNRERWKDLLDKQDLRTTGEEVKPSGTKK